MAGSKKAAKWPLAYKQVDLNQDGNLIKLVAIITMVIDHTGKMLFKSNTMRIVGRLSFPLFAYCIAMGCVYTRNHAKYISRLTMIGLISQPFYALSLDHTVPAMYAISFRDNPVGAVVNFYVQSWAYPNIFLTLILGILVIWTIREKQLWLTLALMLFVWKAQSGINYGWRGVALILLFYLFINHWWLSLPVMTAYMLWWGLSSGQSYRLFGVSFGIQMFALLALPLIYIHTHSKLKVNKWVFYLLYPGHLIGLLLIELALKSI